MSSNTLHFQSYEPAIRYHISRRLLKAGWQTCAQPELAQFTDDNLRLNDSVSILLEYKHLNALLIQRFCPEIAPESFALDDINYRAVLERLWYHKQADAPWVLKPSLLNNGDHIVLFNSIKEAVEHYQQPQRLSGSHVLQRYLQPKLWEGKKFTFRVPGVLTNYDGVFLYKQGYINRSALPYDPSFNPEDRRAHITNYILDGKLAGIAQFATSEYPGFDNLYPKMLKMVAKLLKAVCAVFPDYLKPAESKAFEIFGFDFMLDEKGRLFLLEVNQGPDFPMIANHPLDRMLWNPFWQAIIDCFVLPLAQGSPSHWQTEFRQALTKSQSTNTGWWSLRKGRKFKERFEQSIQIQKLKN